MPGFVIGATTDKGVLEPKIGAEGAENFYRFRRNLGPDTVTREHGNQMRHGEIMNSPTRSPQSAKSGKTESSPSGSGFRHVKTKYEPDREQRAYERNRHPSPHILHDLRCEDRAQSCSYTPDVVAKTRPRRSE